MPIPLPDSLRGLVAKSQSLSLRFDRGYDGYDEKTWGHRKASAANPKDGKTQFLETFVQAFNANGEARELYGHVIARRSKALEPLVPVPHTSTSALIIGIGRWNPVEVGFTFDRFSGSPFLPGSSVKGLLRAAAALVSKGELDGDKAFWNEATVSRIFGEQDQRGAFAFYDAYPAVWPTIEVDVMTPHHSKYYDGTLGFAADWDEPVPVHFVRVKAGTRFLFWFGPRGRGTVETAGRAQNDADRGAIEKLLTIALDWLGAGAKTSSGYGWFEAPAAPPPPRPEDIVVWERALLEWLPQTGSIRVTSGNQRPETKDPKILGSLSEEVWARLKKRRNVTATVHAKRDNKLFIVTRIEPD
jgi:CRISPR type III-B/RAMP module RAMP protein Cmr6